MTVDEPASGNACRLELYVILRDSTRLLRKPWTGQGSGWGTGARAASAARPSQTPSRVCRTKTTNVRSPRVGRADHRSRIERGLGMRAGDDALAPRAKLSHVTPTTRDPRHAFRACIERTSGTALSRLETRARVSLLRRPSTCSGPANEIGWRKGLIIFLRARLGVRCFPHCGAVIFTDPQSVDTRGLYGEFSRCRPTGPQ